MARLDEKLRALKQQRRVTAKEIARACGVSPQAVQSWLTGKTPRSTHLASLAAYFSVSIDYLSGNDDGAERAAAEREIVSKLPALTDSQIYAVLIMVRELQK